MGGRPIRGDCFIPHHNVAGKQNPNFFTQITGLYCAIKYGGDMKDEVQKPGEDSAGQTLKKAARELLFGETRSISIGRSRNSASVNWQTPVVILKGSDQPPTLKGQPYLKTQFQNGAFHKTLYTYSTLRIVVGESWKVSAI